MKTLLAALSVFVGLTGFSQTFQWDTNDTIEANLDFNTTVQYPMYQSAIGQDTVTLAIQVIYNDIPATWDGMVCIYGTCLGVIPSVGTTAQMDPIYGSTQGMVRLTVNPYNGTEVAKLQIYVYDIAFPNDGDTATWLLNRTLGVDDQTAVAYSIAPNPVHDVLTIDVDAEVISGSIVDMEGRLVREMHLSKEHSLVDVSDLKEGVYVILLETTSGIVNSRFVKE